MSAEEGVGSGAVCVVVAAVSHAGEAGTDAADAVGATGGVALPTGAALSSGRVYGRG